MQNSRADIKLFLHLQDTSNYMIKISKDKILVDDKLVVVPGKIVLLHHMVIQKGQPNG